MVCACGKKETRHRKAIMVNIFITAGFNKITFKKFTGVCCFQ
jgi:hypothetical protein